jgi:predicted permease
VAWYHRLLNVFRPTQVSEDIKREVEFHIAERADDLRVYGFSEREAAYEARRRFGNRAMQRERTRDADLLTWLDSAMNDIRYALRGLKRSPVFALVAIGSIALGIGANVAIFSLLDAVSLRTLPVPHPEELLQVGVAHEGEGGFAGVKPEDQRFSNPLWEALRSSPHGFTSLAAFANLRVNLADQGESRFIIGAFASGDYFRLFGVTPALGRLFTARDDVRGCPPTVVLSHSFWTSEFARDRRVIGRRLSLDGKSFEIIGVANEDFTGPVVGVMPRLLVPLCAERAIRGPRSRLDARTDWWLSVIGRRPADADPRQIGSRLMALAPAAHKATIPIGAGPTQQRIYLSHTFSLGDASRGLSDLHLRFGAALIALMAFVVVVMLIACANVANLLLARAAARRRELAVRLALGAERARVARQLLTESILLATLGAVGGLLVARWGSAALVALISTRQGPAELDISLHWRLLGYTAFIAIATVILFGVVPAWRATRVDPHTAMSASGRAVAEGHSRFTLGKALVCGQVALSLTLLVAAGLLVGSLRKLATENPGFRPDGILVVTADFRRTGLPNNQVADVQANLLEMLRSIPGVVDASQSYMVPVSGNRWNDVVAVEGYTPKDPDDAQIWFNRVSPRYFATLGTRLLAGRDFNVGDSPTAPVAAIVNEAFGRRFFRTPNVVGRQFSTRRGDELLPPVTIVGVVENSRYQSLREDAGPIAYLAMSQGEQSPMMIAEVRANGDPAALIPSVRVAVSRVNPRIVLELQTLSEQLWSSIGRERLLAVLSALFGAVALLLATLGLYGVMAYSVAGRTNELGVRQALGAGRSRIIRLVLGDVARIVIAGMIVGTTAALWLSRFVSSFLFQMEPTEPSVLVFAALTLSIAAAVAGIIPAWRASRVDAVMALRYE